MVIKDIKYAPTDDDSDEVPGTTPRNRDDIGEGVEEPFVQSDEDNDEEEDPPEGLGYNV